MTILLFIGAILLTAATHYLSGWMWSLCIPLMYGIFAPNVTERTWLWTGGITVSAWVALFTLNFLIAAEPTLRVINTMAGLIQASLPGFILPVLSFVFAGIVGALTGQLASGVRKFLSSFNAGL